MKTPKSILRVAQIIAERRKPHSSIVVVVSAMGQMTDDLVELARQINPQPPERELDMLMSVGERISMSLLAMALSGLGLDAISFTGSQSGIITNSQHSQASILRVQPHRILPHIQFGKIAIVAGFQGVSEKGEITTLGRGGSDTSAVALGIALKAEKVEFYKDVPGIFSEDPKVNKNAILHELLTYDEALTIAEKAPVLHPRAIKLAKQKGILLSVRSFIGETSSRAGTEIKNEKPDTGKNSS